MLCSTLRDALHAAGQILSAVAAVGLGLAQPN